MADQEFNIQIRTLADLTGIKLTQQQLDALRQAAAQGNVDAINALRQLSDAQKQALKETNVGFTGSAIGVGTIVTLLNSAINRWKAFNDEQDRWVDKAIEAQEKSRELGLALADALDAMKSAERIKLEPLEDSFTRLTQKVTELKTELKIAFESGAYDDAKKYLEQLRVVESQLDRVNSGLDRQKRAAAEAAKAMQKDFVEAQDAASQGVKHVLANEQAAAAARAAGQDRNADLLQRSADLYEKSLLPEQQAELAAIREKQRALSALQSTPQPKPTAAAPPVTAPYAPQPAPPPPTDWTTGVGHFGAPPAAPSPLPSPKLEEHASNTSETLKEILSFIKQVW